MIDLMGYSVLVDNEEQAEKLQEIAIGQGFRWRDGSKKIQYLNEKSFQFGCSGDKVITCIRGKTYYQDKHITKKAHFNDLFKDKFTPIAMKCTQEQFNAIRPKLKGVEVRCLSPFNNICRYLINNLNGDNNVISNVTKSGRMNYNRVVHEEWDEEIFLKACRIEVETHEERLEKAEEILTLENVKVDCRGLTGKEIIKISNIIYNKKGTRPVLTANGYIVHGYKPMRTIISYEKFMELFDNKEETLQEKEQRLLKELEVVKKEIEESKIKVGDWIINMHTATIFKNDTINLGINHPNRYKKITNKQLIELLENEIK